MGLVLKHSDACNRIRLAVSDLGGLSLTYTTGMFEAAGRPVKVGLPGASDIIACIGGRFVAIEVKVGRDRQRVDQHFFEAAVRNSGGLYVLARFSDTEDGVETLRAAIKCPRCFGTGAVPCRDEEGEFAWGYCGCDVSLMLALDP